MYQSRKSEIAILTAHRKIGVATDYRDYALLIVAKVWNCPGQIGTIQHVKPTNAAGLSSLGGGNRGRTAVCGNLGSTPILLLLLGPSLLPSFHGVYSLLIPKPLALLWLLFRLVILAANYVHSGCV